MQIPMFLSLFRLSEAPASRNREVIPPLAKRMFWFPAPFFWFRFTGSMMAIVLDRCEEALIFSTISFGRESLILLLETETVIKKLISLFFVLFKGTKSQSH